VVPPASHRISRVPRYSGYILLLSHSRTGLSPSAAALSNAVSLCYLRIMMSTTPDLRRDQVWPFTSSFATTKVIDVSFFSSGYLDVSLPRVPSSRPMDSVVGDGALPPPGFPIRISLDQCLFAAPQGFSQLIASFVGNQCHGIHPALLFA
jgi:hypothetical protein